MCEKWSGSKGKELGDVLVESKCKTSFSKVDNE